MRPLLVLGVALISAMLANGVARADYVPPVTGNDTGGIISYNLVGQVDVRAIAVQHCARYGKVVKLTGVQANYGGYISFACRWVPYGANERPLRTRY
ncbi:signal peptide protein [Rhodopseudomonas palustris]|uniref:Signal peptide protein n=1 Tax=Rhodopseudomonas palustris TaxID=1076 RepID=A0A0D7F2J0_RHOPL|nr:signal peptide protein [Rhodopseudomonas palustris]